MGPHPHAYAQDRLLGMTPGKYYLFAKGKKFMSIDTIIAQCTPSGSGAIALLRISGPQAFSIVKQCAHLSSGLSLAHVPTHTIHHGWVVDAQHKKLDGVLFLVMRGPRTFTGQDTIEITCHNNQFLIDALIQRILACGARPAQPGEFTRIAVENDKIDLLQAEAINELIHANSQQALKQAFNQLEGSLSSWVTTLEHETLLLIGLCEASFEFLEEDVDFSPQMRTKLQTILETISHLKKTFDQQQLMRQGVRIALVGTVNAGKSSLFNALVGKNRAIVTSIAGTTRDVIESGVYLNGQYWTFVDTAGLRQTDDVIEKEGIERSYHEARTADLILLVADGSRALSLAQQKVYQTLLTTYSQKTVLVINKMDLPQTSLPLTCTQVMPVSTKTGKGIQILQELLTETVARLFAATDCPFLLNKRHMTLLLSFEQKLQEVKALLEDRIEYELIAHHLKEAVAILMELTGKSVSENAMDLIFKEFCVGK